MDGSRRALFLDQASVDPVIAEVTFAQAVTRLEDGLSRLPELAAALEAEAGPVMEGGGREGVPPVTVFGIDRAGARWVLATEHPHRHRRRPLTVLRTSTARPGR